MKKMKIFNDIYMTKWIHFTFISFTIILFSCKGIVDGAYSKAITDSTYTEVHRPQFHFTPPSKWMNDPNGMVFFEGEYHLFYQYYPDSTVWGPMHWGHAVSRDLVQWEHLPIALYPDSLGYIFSGSAVVDWNNTSGFGKNGNPPLVAIYTQHLIEGERAGRSDFQYQSIAYSNDKGRTWTKYTGNPVIPNTQKIKDFRDPKVIWDEDSKQWVMVFAAQDHVMFWGSPNLIKWTHLSNFGKEYGAHGGVWECPDLFPMKVEGTDETKWVLLQSLNPGSPNGGSGTQYFVGNFDGQYFTLDPSFAPAVTGGKAVWLDWGRDNYAGVTWSDVPKEDGRRLMLGWMSNWDYAQVVPTTTWRSAMTIPRSLLLKKTDFGYRILSKPVKEIEALMHTHYNIKDEIINKEIDLTEKLGFSPSKMEVLLEIELPENQDAEFGIVLSNTRGEEYIIGFDSKKNEYFSNRTKAGNNNFSNKFAVKRHTAPRESTDKIVQLHLIFDVASCELFADNGMVAMTEIFFPSENFSRLNLYENCGGIIVKTARFRSIR
jgi:fructan beta-fructosidase